LIGRVKLPRENEAGGSWGQNIHTLHVNVIGLCLAFSCNNRTVPKQCISVILSEGLLQAEAMEHFAGDNNHGNYEL